MKKAISFIFILFSIVSKAQDFSPKTLKIAENPTNNDFSFLKEELKNVQVVMLGENTHFDGNVFEMKIKIIKYLHEEMGFNTIAFESGTYDVWKAQQEVSKGTNTRTAFENSLFQHWSRTKEFQDFIEYYDKNKTGLKLFGFDNQITGKYGDEQLIIDLFDYCNENKLILKLDIGDLQLVVESMYNSNIFDENDITYNQYNASLTDLLKSINRKQNNEVDFYWTRIIKNLLSLGDDFHNKKESIISAFSSTIDDNIRDKQMADNLLDYIKTHPNEKIICWGANAHFVNDMSSIKEPILKEYIPMGSYIKTVLKDKVYSLAAITAEDSIHLNGKQEKTPLDIASFEYFLKKKENTLSFISSKQKEMQVNKINRLFSFETFVYARLDLLFDGYIYFNTVKPYTLLYKDDDTSIKNNLNTKQTSSKKKQLINDTIENKGMFINKVNLLDEVIIINKKFPYTIIKKTIENIEKNYPSNNFNSQLYSSINVKVKDTTYLDFEFIANQYDRGYNQTDRSTKQLKEIRWNIKNGYEPKSLGSDFYRSFTHNPIMYGNFLNNRKFKKFVFTQEEDSIYNGLDVYVLNFSTLRDHFNYTKRSFFSNYAGKIYINKSDYGIVKIIENWEVTEATKYTNSEYELYGWPKRYMKKETSFEICETYYVKNNGLYYLYHTVNNLTGNLFDKENKLSKFTMKINSHWDNFNSSKTEPISFKKEENLFEKIEYRKLFWDTYTLPK